MSKLFDGDSPSNLYEYSVSEISGSIKRTVENAFEHVRLRGEISGYRGPHSSGHAYFSLKDDRARIDAVIWKGVFGRLKFRPEEGMEVIATGKITTFPGSSKYQIVIENLEPAGAGALMALLEERKRKLGAEGLFDAARKQLLPFMPAVIGVVTSPTGAVIRDILHRISDRFPVNVIVWPVKVQGEGSGDAVAAAIRGFNALEPGSKIARPDVLIVARGGGSLEDLWGFNDEAVVRAAADSDIPLISAVGHETDWTLIDYAADVRAPTPTGAAEMAVPVKADLDAQIAALDARLKGSMTRHLDLSRQNLRSLARALPSLDQLLALPRRRFDEAAASLGRGLQLNTLNKRRTFDNTAYKLRPDILKTRIAQHRQKIGEHMLRADRYAERQIDRSKSRIVNAETALRALPGQFAREIRNSRERLANLTSRSDTAVKTIFERQKYAITAQTRMLESLSYKNVLQRGYAVVRSDEGDIISASSGISHGQHISIQFADGDVDAVAGSDSTPPAPKRKPAKPATPDKPDQGSLF